VSTSCCLCHLPDTSQSCNEAAVICTSMSSILVFQAYQAAIARVIKKKKVSAGDAHVVDLGTGSGLLAMMAVTAGADTVVACDLHESLCNVARQV